MSMPRGSALALLLLIVLCRPVFGETIFRIAAASNLSGTLDRIAEAFAASNPGVSAEIAMRVQQEAFDYLDAPVLRVTGKDVPMPYAANLEKLALPSVAEVVAAAKAVLYRT